MWFKNMRLYRLLDQWTLTPEELNTALEPFTFNPCGSLDAMRYGFVSPLGRHGSELVHATAGNIMVCAKKQEKILPASVINEQLDEKVSAISEAEGRKVSRKERQELKDEIIFSLMPKAFSKSSLDFAYIAPAEGLVVVNASSATRAEDLISALREAMGSLRTLPIVANNQPSEVMTHWLRSDELPQDIQLGDECEFKATKDERIIRCKKQDVQAEEMLKHLESGMFVSKLAISWNDAIHCIIDEDLAIKRVKFDDKIYEQAHDRNPESAAEQFDADFQIMALEIKSFVASLLHAFGGEKQKDPI